MNSTHSIKRKRHHIHLYEDGTDNYSEDFCESFENVTKKCRILPSDFCEEEFDFQNTCGNEKLVERVTEAEFEDFRQWVMKDQNTDKLDILNQEFEGIKKEFSKAGGNEANDDEIWSSFWPEKTRKVMTACDAEHLECDRDLINLLGSMKIEENACKMEIESEPILLVQQK